MVLNFADGPSHNLEDVEVVISTPFMESRVIGNLFMILFLPFAIRQHLEFCSFVAILGSSSRIHGSIFTLLRFV